MLCLETLECPILDRNTRCIHLTVIYFFTLCKYIILANALLVVPHTAYVILLGARPKNITSQGDCTT